MATEVRTKLQQLVSEGGWNKAWEEKVTPWDLGIIQPPLRDLINSGELDLPRKGRALVPGCGKGYDAIFIASSLGLDTTAIDISPIAVQAANDVLKSSSDSGLDNISFQEGDFFTLNVTENDRFDLIYDYTFFVAISPSLRSDWARKTTELIKPGGYLITLVFPIEPPSDKGPPYFVRPEHYLEVLGQNWEQVIDKIPEVSSETHIGKERLIVWKRI